MPSPLVDHAVEILTKAGYRALSSPVSVGSVSFEFAAVLVGSERALDLVVVIDTINEAEGRIRQKIEGLGRALDLVGSRRPLTVVLVGPLPVGATLDAISRVCRVLPVGTPTGPAAENFLSDALAVLLPLQIPKTAEAVVDPLDQLQRRLGIEDGAPDARLSALLTASQSGADAVRQELRKELLTALRTGLPGTEIS